MLLHKHQRPVRTCITDHGLVSPVAGSFLGLHTKAGWIPGGCFPFPLGKSKESLIALCHGVLQPLNPCVATVCSLPQPLVAIFLNVPLKALSVKDGRT